MGTKTTVQERTFTEVKRLSYAGLDGMALMREMVESLRQAIPTDAYCIHTIDPPSRLITHGEKKEFGGEREARLFFEEIYFEDYVSRYNWMAKSRPSVSLLSEVTGGRLERSLRYRELTGPLGLGYEARVDGPVRREIWGGMDLIREQDRPDFDAREISFLRRISSHLGAGLKAAALRLQATEQNGDVMPGVLTLDGQGWVAQYTPAAERWLKEIEDLRPDWREGGLPAAVWTVSGSLRRALKPETDRDSASVPRLHVRARSGRWLTLHGSLSEPTSDRPGETVIIIEPARPAEITWLCTAAYSLSAREREVVRLVASGLSTRQISRTLYISEYTVQNHVSNACEKIGVRSRRELVRHLFFDNLYPQMFG